MSTVKLTSTEVFHAPLEYHNNVALFLQQASLELQHRVTAAPQHLEEIARLAAAQRNEPINAIHLLLAAYKLGKTDQFGEIRKLLDAVDDVEDAFYLIHVLASAYTEQLPAHVIADIPALIHTLDAVARRLPDAEAYCAEMKAQLTEILQGKVIPSDRQCC